MGNNRSHAVKLASKGYRVTPLNGKRPITPDWVNVATSTPRDASRIWSEHPDANVGIVTGSSLVVLDMDPRNGGEASLAKLERAIGPLPEATVRTGGGGCHWYFTTDTPVASGKLLPGLDIKGEGGQVVAPPSIHPDTGQPYEFVNGALPLPAPDKLLEFIRAHSTEEPQERVATDFITSGTRNDDLTRLAGWMRGQGANQHQIETALIALAKESGLEVREAKRTARSIASKPSGLELDIAKVVRSLDVREEAHRRRRTRDAVVPELPPHNFKEILKRPRKKLIYSIPGLQLQGGNSLIIAQAKTGKTTLMMNVLKSYVDRVPLFGEFEVNPPEGRVAYFNYELIDEMFLQWLQDVSLRRKSRLMPLTLRGESGCLWTPEGQAKTIAWLKHHRVGTLIIDPAVAAARGIVEDENSNDQVGEFCAILDQVKLAAGVSDVLMPLHIGKGHTDEGSEHGRGASRWEGWADDLWVLTRDNSGIRSLRAYGRSAELEAHDLSYDHGSRLLTMEGTRSSRRTENKVIIEKLAGDSQLNQMLDILRKLGGRASRVDIAARAPWAEKTTRKLVIQAEDQGLVMTTLGLRGAIEVELTGDENDPGKNPGK